MAKVTATVFKAQVALMATALTTALQDDTLTETAAEFANPHHPLRMIKKFFVYNPKTGVFLAADSYVDKAYDGNFPTRGSTLDKVADTTDP